MPPLIDGERFVRVSGKAPKLEVEAVGWAWAGQFLDVDNDGHLDIYSLSGFYSTPEPFNSPEDL